MSLTHRVLLQPPHWQSANISLINCQFEAFLELQLGYSNSSFAVISKNTLARAGAKSMFQEGASFHAEEFSSKLLTQIALLLAIKMVDLKQQGCDQTKLLKIDRVSMNSLRAAYPKL